ncbi:hypothetical protein [Maribacter arcticus]|uniref:Tellurite resistance protein TerB n=1 Tax=Maribacter arcticus TaxID=561365 RepID=A0A1T5CI33_9FLAO|nr:hypothetical protein [Maribacter arcticus]SKB59107.1 hypothetical protein SAMN05660866_02316 [Maribacter arcticus]
MTLFQKTGNELYQNLGKLFYAVALADKNVRPIEVEKLKETVKQQWLSVDAIEDEFGSDAAYQIEIVFDWLKEEEKESELYFEEFKDFFKEHNGRFNKKIKVLIWKIANAIASSFSGKNKSELILLSKIKALLQ